MARVKSIITINGTLEGLNFYLRKGEPTVRKAGGGFNSDAIKHKPSMVRVRENSSEFGGCMQAVKHFKMALLPQMSLFKDGQTHQRLVQLFTQIKECDTISERGKRSVGMGMQTDPGRALLQGYIMNSGIGLAAILGQPFRFEWETNGFVVPDFDTSKTCFPKGATHLELSVGWLSFNFFTYDYSYRRSEPVLIHKYLTPTSLQISPYALPDAEGTQIGIVFLRYVQELNGIQYPMKAADHLLMEIGYCY